MSFRAFCALVLVGLLLGDCSALTTFNTLTPVDLG